MTEAIKGFLLVGGVIALIVFLFGMFTYTSKQETSERQAVFDKCAPVCYPYRVYEAEPCTCDGRFFRMEPNE